MKQKSASSSNSYWIWEKWILPAEQDLWAAKLDEEFTGVTWSLRPSSESDRVLLEVYLNEFAPASLMRMKWGGRTKEVSNEEWMNPPQPEPLKLGKRLTIIHEGDAKPAKTPVLCVPYGMAFGSGDHETTEMLLRALVAEKEMPDLLDLGTGSGILALAARKLGAKVLTGIDFESDAIRICRENESANFDAPAITWIQADLTQWDSTQTWPRIIANLYSDLLITLAPKIRQWIAPEGELWMSGILNSQAEEVVKAYKAGGWTIQEQKKKGKWVMLKARP